MSSLDNMKEMLQEAQGEVEALQEKLEPLLEQWVTKLTRVSAKSSLAFSAQFAKVDKVLDKENLTPTNLPSQNTVRTALEELNNDFSTFIGLCEKFNAHFSEEIEPWIQLETNDTKGQIPEFCFFEISICAFVWSQTSHSTAIFRLTRNRVGYGDHGRQQCFGYNSNGTNPPLHIPPQPPKHSVAYKMAYT